MLLAGAERIFAVMEMTSRLDEGKLTWSALVVMSQEKNPGLGHTIYETLLPETFALMT